MSRCHAAWWLVAAIFLIEASPVHPQPSEVRGIGFDEALEGPSIVVEALEASALGPLPIPVNVWLRVPRPAIERQPGQYDFAALDARIADYARRDNGIRVVLDLGDDIPDQPGLAEQSRFVRALAARYRGVVRGYALHLPPVGRRPAARDFAFFVKMTVVDVRSGDESAATILGSVSDLDGAFVEELYREDVAAYLDLVGLTAGRPFGAILAQVERHDPTAALILLGSPLGEEPSEARRRFVEQQVAVAGTRIEAVTYEASPSIATAVLPVVSFLRDLLGQRLVSVEDAQVGLKLTQDGLDVKNGVPHKLLFGLGTLTNYFVYTAGARALEVRLSDPTGARPMLLDALTGTRRRAEAWTYDPASRVATIGLPASDRVVIIDWNTADRGGYTDLLEVASPTLPSLAEIIARHQQTQAAQDEAVATYIAKAKMEQHFRATAADLAFDVVTDNTFFVEGDQVEFEERSFRLNGTPWGADRPPFPLLQAEKVLSLPFDLRLTTDYRYRLDGLERVEGRDAFVVRFDPVDAARTLYRGTVWIDRTTFQKVKVQTVQTASGAPVLASEEIQYFSDVGTARGRPVILMTRLVGRQSILIAGRNLLLEREVLLDSFQINPPDFDAQRLAARASDHIMYRDTDDGLRYLVKRDGERVVASGATTSATALLLGVTYDPAYDFPLPLGGLNYLDFDFLSKNNQLAVTFGGVLALVNLQRPNLLGKSVDGGLDLFAIAVPSSDRAYSTGGERPGERVLTVPFNTGANVGWRFAGFHRLVASYQFRFDWYGTEESTAETFTAPSSTITNGIGLSWEWKPGAYSLAAGWSGFRRGQWRAWGFPGDYDPATTDYAKYSASASKVFFTGAHKFTLNGAYYGGHDLDRFSKYQFGFFDENRVRGVPSAGVRFAEIGMFRGAYSFNLLDLYRLDMFFDQAVGRDRAVAPGWQPVTGIGFAFSTRGPRNTMLRGDFSKSFLPDRYREPGSVVFQFQILKPL